MDYKNANCSLKQYGEIFVKSMTDCWVVGKVSDERELYVFVNQKNANLIEVSGKCDIDDFQV